MGGTQGCAGGQQEQEEQGEAGHGGNYSRDGINWARLGDISIRGRGDPSALTRGMSGKAHDIRKNPVRQERVALVCRGCGVGECGRGDTSLPDEATGGGNPVPGGVLVDLGGSPLR